VARGHSAAPTADGQQVLQRLFGPEQAGQANLARFELKAFDEVYDRLTVLPDGPERKALFAEAKRLMVAMGALPDARCTASDADLVAQPWVWWATAARCSGTTGGTRSTCCPTPTPEPRAD
jgi:hypothetical protein